MAQQSKKFPKRLAQETEEQLPDTIWIFGHFKRILFYVLEMHSFSQIDYEVFITMHWL